jgi:hypothetical protein
MPLASTAILRDKRTMGVFSKAKDRVLEQMALKYLNTRLLEPYGQATRLRLNSEEKSIHVEVELKGETEPVQVELTGYDVRRHGTRYFATVKEIRTSRDWLTTLAQTRVCNSRFELPAQVARLLIVAL